MLNYVFPADLTAADLTWVEYSNRGHPESEWYTPEEVEDSMRDGTLHMLRWSEDAAGVVLFRTEGERLRVTRIVGTNTVAHWGVLIEALRKTAREWGCTLIESLVYDSKVAKVLAGYGCVAEAVLLTLEVGHGQ